MGTVSFERLRGMKKTGIYCICLVVVGIAVQLLLMKGLQDDSKMVEAFRVGDSMPLSGELCVTGHYPTYLVGKEEQKELLMTIAKGLGMESCEICDEDPLRLSAANAVAQAEILLIRDADTQGLSVSTKIAVQDEISSVIQWKAKVKEVYERLRMSCRCEIYMQGAYGCELSALRKRQIANEILQVLEARVIRTQNLEETSIYYGYSHLLGDSKTVEGQRVNTQLIFTFDETTKQTKVILSVPYHNGSY